MRNAIGFILVLWALSKFFSEAFLEFDDAAAETFRTVELAAQNSQAHLREK